MRLCVIAAGCYTDRGMYSANELRGLSLLAVALLCTAATVAAQTLAAPDLPPGELVRLAVANEVAPANIPAVRHRFRSRKQTPKGSLTRLYVQTNEALAAMLIAINDQPLTAQQKQGELNHLAWLMGSPDQFRKKHAQEKKDADQTLRIVKALPDAFRYVYANTESTMPGTSQDLVRLNFTPNPAYVPPSRIEQVLQGMQGFLLIDPERRRIAQIDGTLFRDVSFGWGIVGRLNKGGHFLVRQANVGDGSWAITEMQLNITGTILLFKTLTMVSDEVFSDFRPVPDNLTFGQGVEMLKSGEKMAHDGRTP